MARAHTHTHTHTHTGTHTHKDAVKDADAAAEAIYASDKKSYNSRQEHKPPTLNNRHGSDGDTDMQEKDTARRLHCAAHTHRHTMWPWPLRPTHTKHQNSGARPAGARRQAPSPASCYLHATEMSRCWRRRRSQHATRSSRGHTSRHARELHFLHDADDGARGRVPRLAGRQVGDLGKDLSGRHRQHRHALHRRHRLVNRRHVHSGVEVRARPVSQRRRRRW